MPVSDIALLECVKNGKPLVTGGLGDSLLFRGGAFTLPTGPGLGIEMDVYWLSAHEVDRYPPITLDA